MTERPRLYGADYSVYVRIVRMCLAEKGVAYDLEPIDIFSAGGPPPHYLARHPFGRIPAFEHDGVRIYETGAIARYVDERFEGPPLQPADVPGRARCNQIISIADNYAYPSFVWGIYVERISKPRDGAPADQERIAAALPQARTCLAALAELMGSNAWLAGPDLTLADLYAAPMFDCLLLTPEGQDLVREFSNLEQWWEKMTRRPSFRDTEPARS